MNKSQIKNRNEDIINKTGVQSNDNFATGLTINAGGTYPERSDWDVEQVWIWNTVLDSDQISNAVYLIEGYDLPTTTQLSTLQSNNLVGLL